MNQSVRSRIKLIFTTKDKRIYPLLKRYGVCLSVCLFVCLSDGKVSDGKGIKNVLIPGAAAGGRRQEVERVQVETDKVSSYDSRRLPKARWLYLKCMTYTT